MCAEVNGKASAGAIAAAQLESDMRGVRELDAAKGRSGAGAAPEGALEDASGCAEVGAEIGSFGWARGVLTWGVAEALVLGVAPAHGVVVSICIHVVRGVAPARGVLEERCVEPRGVERVVVACCSLSPPAAAMAFCLRSLSACRHVSTCSSLRISSMTTTRWPSQQMPARP